MNLVDTSAWLEYFFDGPNAGVFAGPIEDNPKLLVSVICLYEVFKKLCSTADEGRALRAVACMKQGTVSEVSEEIALRASLVSLKYGIPMADSLIYATAKLHGATVWTQDQDFKDLPGVSYTPKR